MKKKPYVIRDWTGRELTALGAFTTFDNGWEFIRGKFPEADWEDLFVCDIRQGE